MKNNFKRGDKVKFWDSSSNEWFFGTVIGRVLPGVHSYRIKNVKTESGYSVYPTISETVVDDNPKRAMKLAEAFSKPITVRSSRQEGVSEIRPL